MKTIYLFPVLIICLLINFNTSVSQNKQDRNKISASDIKSTTTYRILYDNGKPTGDSLINYHIEYDKEGNILQDFDYYKGHLFAKYFYKFSKNGFIKAETFEYYNEKTGQVNDAIKTNYNNDGKKLEKIHYTFILGDTLLDRSIYKYDTKNDCELSVNVTDNDSIVSKTCFKYDKNGNAIEETHTNSNGVVNLTYSRLFNDSGNLIQEISTNTDKDFEYKIICKYNDSNIKTEQIRYDGNGNLQSKTKFTKYDSNGNLLESITYNSNDNILSVYHNQFQYFK
jgi:hypothetical protein